MHGGRSTGLRTQEGIARLRAAPGARRRKPRTKPYAPAAAAPAEHAEPKPQAPAPQAHAAPAAPKPHTPETTAFRLHPAVAARPSPPSEPHAPAHPGHPLLPTRVSLRDRLLVTSTLDGILDDAIRTLGWSWIADRIAQGDAHLLRWLAPRQP